MNRFEVIGLSGKAGSGKDYIGQSFLKLHGYHQFSLAWPFKVEAVGMHIATFEEVFVTKPPHVRKWLQERGTENGRLVAGENIWCDTVHAWFCLLEKYWGIRRFFIPDIRFSNEVDYVQKVLGGRVFRIIAPKRVAQSTLSETARNHSSEVSLEDDDPRYDGIIYNDPEHSNRVRFQVLDLLVKYKLYSEEY